MATKLESATLEMLSENALAIDASPKPVVVTSGFVFSDDKETAFFSANSEQYQLHWDEVSNKNGSAGSDYADLYTWIVEEIKLK